MRIAGNEGHLKWKNEHLFTVTSYQNSKLSHQNWWLLRCNLFVYNGSVNRFALLMNGRSNEVFCATGTANPLLYWIWNIVYLLYLKGLVECVTCALRVNTPHARQVSMCIFFACLHRTTGCPCTECISIVLQGAEEEGGCKQKPKGTNPYTN